MIILFGSKTIDMNQVDSFGRTLGGDFIFRLKTPPQSCLGRFFCEHKPEVIKGYLRKPEEAEVAIRKALQNGIEYFDLSEY